MDRCASAGLDRWSEPLDDHENNKKERAWLLPHLVAGLRMLLFPFCLAVAHDHTHVGKVLAFNCLYAVTVSPLQNCTVDSVSSFLLCMQTFHLRIGLRCHVDVTDTVI